MYCSGEASAIIVQPFPLLSLSKGPTPSGQANNSQSEWTHFQSRSPIKNQSILTTSQQFVQIVFLKTLHLCQLCITRIFKNVTFLLELTSKVPQLTAAAAAVSTLFDNGAVLKE